jgi:hypothetical protein
MKVALTDPRDNPLIPISDTEISQKLPGIKIVSYPELANGLPFDSQGRFMLLYVTDVSKDAQLGHWVCVFKKDKSIFYFDSYGNLPDEPLSWLSQNKRKSLHQYTPYLSQHLKASGLPVYYNPFPLQSPAHKIATCGKHCVIRLIHRDKSIDDYAAFLKSINKNTDLAVEQLWNELGSNLSFT